MKIDSKNIAEKISEALNGLSFVVSGVFNKFTRDEIKNLIEINGGKIQSGVSAKTSYLVAGDESGPSKLEKAAKLNVKIIGEFELENLINKK